MKSYPIPVNQNSEKFIEELEVKTIDYDKSGVYQLYYFENGKPRIIGRLIGNDINGILYIGMTTGPLKKRVSNLQKALRTNSDKDIEKPSSSGHTQMGQKYFRVRKKININDLYISIFPTENASPEESIRLDNYVKEYGELPPMNGQYGSTLPDWTMF